MPAPKKKVNKEMLAAAVAAMWHAADLELVAYEGKPLHSGQRKLLKQFYESSTDVFVVLCARQYGKSILLAALAIMEGLKGKRVLMAADEQRHIKEITEITFNIVLATCPPELRPKWDALRVAYTFPSGGVVRFIGLDRGQADKGRGTKEDLVIIDEAGFAEELEYFINSVAVPQLTHTGGRIVAVSTPSVSPAHPFKSFCDYADSKGALFTETFWDIPDSVLSQKKKLAIQQESFDRLGPMNTDWRRERLCEWVTEETKAVIPEWRLHRDKVVMEMTRPEYFDPIVVIDMGYSDLTVAGFGYWDFQEKCLVLEDECWMRRSIIRDIDQAVSAKESELWPTQRPMQRLVDAPPQVIAEFNTQSSIPISAVQKRGATGKTFRDASLERLRSAVQEGWLRVHPRCEVTIHHLETAIWNSARTDWARPDEGTTRSGIPLGHFDALDMARYAVWSVQKHRDPGPALPPGVTRDDFILNYRKLRERAEQQRRIARAFRRAVR